MSLLVTCSSSWPAELPDHLVNYKPCSLSLQRKPLLSMAGHFILAQPLGYTLCARALGPWWAEGRATQASGVRTHQPGPSPMDRGWLLANPNGVSNNLLCEDGLDMACAGTVPPKHVSEPDQDTRGTLSVAVLRDGTHVSPMLSLPQPLTSNSCSPRSCSSIGNDGRSQTRICCTHGNALLSRSWEKTVGRGSLSATCAGEGWGQSPHPPVRGQKGSSSLSQSQRGPVPERWRAFPRTCLPRGARV